MEKNLEAVQRMESSKEKAEDEHTPRQKPAFQSHHTMPNSAWIFIPGPQDWGHSPDCQVTRLQSLARWPLSVTPQLSLFTVPRRAPAQGHHHRSLSSAGSAGKPRPPWSQVCVMSLEGAQSPQETLTAEMPAERSPRVAPSQNDKQKVGSCKARGLESVGSGL